MAGCSVTSGGMTDGARTRWRSRAGVAFGTLYLFVPFAMEGIMLPSAALMLLAFAILPTIGGFYCTTKALNYLPTSKVQLFELTEPVFAFVFLSEVIRGAEWIGCALILLAIFISEQREEA
jgi:DME family drug/metabolite transporter